MKNWPASEVVMRKVAELTPYARNSRTHSDAQVSQLAASIKEWGWTMPVLVDEQGGLIAGHGRILAAQRLGLDEVPAMTAKGWSDAKKRAYVIADNKLALNAGWDEELLRLELQELGELGVELDLLGFDEGELEALMDVEVKDDGDVEDAPVSDGREPTTKHGDVFLMGAHRLMCGDSTSIEHVERLIGGGREGCTLDY